MTNQDSFDILEKYVDEILTKEYLSKIANIIDVLVSQAVTRPLTYEFLTPIFIDKDEHMWYNTFNKWNWTKFENGVIKID